MKKITFVIFALILMIGSCKKVDIVPTPKLDLGKVSTTMSFTSTPTLENKYTFGVNVTPGSKYSVQISDFSGDVVSSQGLTADQQIETIKLDIEKINKGQYYLIFINTKGEEIKQILIIK
jgi:hypothetical protein